MNFSGRIVQYDCGTADRQLKNLSKKSENENSVKTKNKTIISEQKPSMEFIEFKSTVEDFINTYDTFTDKEIINILKIFKNPSIEYLIDIFNYDKCILKLSSYLMYLDKTGMDNDSLNEYFWDCMELRLNPEYSRLFKEWIRKSDFIEDKLTEKLNDVKKRYLTCSICKENQVSVLYLPCGHVIVCSKCQDKNNRKCQACSAPINEYHAIYV